eukprot:scaffold65394_cov27-Tisochrysis_lutea.AAC.1
MRGAIWGWKTPTRAPPTPLQVEKECSAIEEVLGRHNRAMRPDHSRSRPWPWPLSLQRRNHIAASSPCGQHRIMRPTSAECFVMKVKCWPACSWTVACGRSLVVMARAPLSLYLCV